MRRHTRFELAMKWRFIRFKQLPGNWLTWQFMSRQTHTVRDPHTHTHTHTVAHTRYKCHLTAVWQRQWPSRRRSCSMRRQFISITCSVCAPLPLPPPAATLVLGQPCSTVSLYLSPAVPLAPLIIGPKRAFNYCSRDLLESVAFNSITAVQQLSSSSSIPYPTLPHPALLHAKLF